MSEPIIIETPTTTRERLVLVPPSCVTEEYESQAGPRLGITGGVARDATPADLERGGFAPLSAFVGPLDLLSPPTLAGALEAIHSVREAVATAYDREADELRERLETAETELSAETIRADEWKAAAIKAEADLGASENGRAETDELLAAETARAETAEAARDALRDQIAAAGCEAAHAGERTYECDVARPCGLCRLRTRAEKAERERDDLLARINQAEEAARALRAELARLTAPGEGSEGGPWRAYGEPTDQELVDAFEHAYRNAPSVRTHATAIRTLYRLGVAHERARQQPAKGRATDEELGRVFGEAYTVEESPDHGVALRTAYLAVAAHVRQERCLVAEAVGMVTGVTISRTSERVPGTTGMWDVYATRRPDVPGEHYAYGVPTADVPATLARLLGEVARG